MQIFFYAGKLGDPVVAELRIYDNGAVKAYSVGNVLICEKPAAVSAAENQSNVAEALVAINQLHPEIPTDLSSWMLRTWTKGGGE